MNEQPQDSPAPQPHDTFAEDMGRLFEIGFNTGILTAIQQHTDIITYFGSWRDLVHTACLPRRTSPCNDRVLSRRILSTPVLPEKRGGDGKNAITSPSRRDADRSNRNRQRRFDHHSCCNASHVVLSPLLCRVVLHPEPLSPQSAGCPLCWTAGPTLAQGSHILLPSSLL